MNTTTKSNSEQPKATASQDEGSIPSARSLGKSGECRESVGNSLISVICAWCDKHMRGPVAVEPVSHGICEHCNAALFANEEAA